MSSTRRLVRDDAVIIVAHPITLTEDSDWEGDQCQLELRPGLAYAVKLSIPRDDKKNAHGVYMSAITFKRLLEFLNDAKEHCLEILAEADAEELEDAADLDKKAGE